MKSALFKICFLISEILLCQVTFVINKVFGGAAGISAHWTETMPSDKNPIPKAFFKYMKENLPDSKTHRLYFVYSNQTLDALHLLFQEKVSEVLMEKGYDKNILYEGADYLENLWSQRLEIPLINLFGKKGLNN